MWPPWERNEIAPANSPCWLQGTHKSLQFAVKSWYKMREGGVNRQKGNKKPGDLSAKID